MGSHLQVEWAETEAELKRLYQQERDHQNRTRLQALWYLRQGKTLLEAAELVGVDRTTVQRWVRWYRKGGIRDILTHRLGGPKHVNARLNSEQQEELERHASAGEFRTIWDGVIWAETQHGVTYTYWGMRGVFAKLKLRKKVPRPRNPKASSEEQEAWKKGD